jgi:hypothetical protein
MGDGMFYAAVFEGEEPPARVWLRRFAAQEPAMVAAWKRFARSRAAGHVAAIAILFGRAPNADDLGECPPTADGETLVTGTMSEA